MTARKTPDAVSEQSSPGAEAPTDLPGAVPTGRKADDRASVQEALASIIGELPGIGKDEQMGTGRGEYGYRYRGIETITRHVQPLLSKHGVVIIPQSNIHAIVPAFESKNTGWQDTILHVNWTIIGPDGSTIEASTIGIGRDNSDKGANKAQSQAFKYLLLQLLCISDADDDTDGHENRSMQGEDRPPDPALLLFEQIRATANTPLADDLKEFAGFQDKKLSAKAFAEDPEWMEVVHTYLTERQAQGEPSDG